MRTRLRLRPGARAERFSRTVGSVREESGGFRTLSGMATSDERQAVLEARILELSAPYPEMPAETLEGAVRALLMGARARSLFGASFTPLAGRPNRQWP
jgi:hypothetical protein